MKSAKLRGLHRLRLPGKPIASGGLTWLGLRGLK